MRRFLTCAAFLMTLAAPALATELIPSVGLVRSVNSSDTRAFAGLALRAPIVHNMLESEIGVAYRHDSFGGGDLRVHSWPITASLWLTPARMLYAGGGVGWYNTTYQYRDGSPYLSSTSQKIGVHVGGGVRVPVGHGAAVDLGSRYVFLGSDEHALVPRDFNPDSWNTSVGLAIRF